MLSLRARFALVLPFALVGLVTISGLVGCAAETAPEQSDQSSEAASKAKSKLKMRTLVFKKPVKKVRARLVRVKVGASSRSFGIFDDDSGDALDGQLRFQAKAAANEQLRMELSQPFTVREEAPTSLEYDSNLAAFAGGSGEKVSLRLSDGTVRMLGEGAAIGAGLVTQAACTAGITLAATYVGTPVPPTFSAIVCALPAEYVSSVVRGAFTDDSSEGGSGGESKGTGNYENGPNCPSCVGPGGTLGGGV